MNSTNVPTALKTFQELRLSNLPPWRMLKGDEMYYFEGFKKYFPNQNIIPFVTRNDRDETAAYDTDRPGWVGLYLTESGPWHEPFKSFDSFLEWFDYMVEVFKIYMIES